MKDTLIENRSVRQFRRSLLKALRTVQAEPRDDIATYAELFEAIDDFLELVRAMCDAGQAQRKSEELSKAEDALDALYARKLRAPSMKAIVANTKGGEA